MSRRDRIETERREFNDWKSSISCYGDPHWGEDIWNVIMDGPEDSPYMGGKFKLRITFPSNYPDGCPNFEFLTPICHININGTHICLDSLNNYKSSYSIVQILTQIFMMLNAPNEDSAYSDYKDLYINHYTEYLAKAREMTREYAK
jgi:ubiquitin-protein ligase